MKKMKFDLKNLEVKSFVTSFDVEKSNTAKGGTGSFFGVGSCGPVGCVTGFGDGGSCVPEVCMAGATMEGEPGC